MNQGSTVSENEIQIEYLRSINSELLEQVEFLRKELARMETELAHLTARLQKANGAQNG